MRGWVAISLLGLSACDGCKKTRVNVPDASDASASASATASVAPPASVTPPIASASASAKPAVEHCVDAPPEAATDDVPMARSHDHRAVAWTESEPADADASYDASAIAFLCFERDGKRRVLLPTDAYDAGEPWNGFQGFVFSRDDRVLFFTTSQYVVTTGAWGVEVATGKSFYIIDGAIVEELDHGPFKGSLLATHFRLDEDHEIGSPGYTGRGVTSDVIDWKGKRLCRLPDDSNPKGYGCSIDGK